MQALRKIIHIDSNIINIDELKNFIGKDVELIILPIDEEEIKTNKKNLLKYCGAINSGFKDTARRVDELVYGF